jgi:DNA-binding NtrC family response regulator
MRSVLIVDDEKHTRDGLSAVLADSYDVFAASNADEAISMLDAEPFDAVITDLRMAGKSGMSVIDKTISMPEKPVCIMLTAYGSMEIAVEAMKRGATDFLPKPVDVDKLETILEQALEKRDQKKKISESENKKNIETEVQSRMSEADNAQTLITTAEMDEAFNGL